MATVATVNSHIHKHVALEVDPEVLVWEQPCPELAGLIEQGHLDDFFVRDVCEEYVEPLLSREIDVVVLGCTHFPFVKPLLEELTAGRIQFVDPAYETSNLVCRILEHKNLYNPQENLGTVKLYFTKDIELGDILSASFLDTNRRTIEHIYTIKEMPYVVYNILTVVVSIIVAIAVLYLLFRLFALKQGDEKVILLPKRATNFQVSDRNFESITLFCDVPFVNKGRQNGTIMDLFPRPLLPEEQFDSVKVDAWAMDINRPRHDGYFEAVIIKPRKGGTIRVYVTLIGKSGNIREDIKGFPYMNIDIYYQVVGREDYHIDKQRIRLTPEEVEPH